MSGDRAGVETCDINEATSALLRGWHKKAARLFERVASQARSRGEPFEEAYALGGAAQAHMQRMDLRAAANCLERIRSRIPCSGGDPRLALLHACRRSFLALLQGELPYAKRLANSAIETGDKVVVVTARGQYGLALALEGNLGDALN